MNRREVLRLLAATAISSTIPSDLFALGREAHRQLGNAVALRTLNKHEDATVATISELIIPTTDTPGAKAARVNEFIDLILTEWYDEEEKSIFMTGLTDVDARARE